MQLEKVKFTIKNKILIPEIKLQDTEEFSAEIVRTEDCQNEKAIVNSCIRGPFIQKLLLIPGDVIPDNIITPLVEIKVFQKKGSSYEVVYNVFSLYFKNLSTFLDACPKKIRDVFFSYYQFKKETFGFDYHPSLIKVETDLSINDYKDAKKNTAVLRLEMYLDPDQQNYEERSIPVCEQGELISFFIQRDFSQMIIKIFLSSAVRGMISYGKKINQFPKPQSVKINFFLITSKESENVNLTYVYKTAESYDKNIQKIAKIFVDILLNYDSRENLQSGIFQYYRELKDVDKQLFDLNIIIFFQSRLLSEMLE